MSRFAAIPEIPIGGMSDWMFYLLSAMKEDIELLTGMRGENDSSSMSVTRSSITVGPVPAPTMTQISATGDGFTVSGAQVASLSDHIALCNDVQKLSNDVAQLRAVVDGLLVQLKG